MDKENYFGVQKTPLTQVRTNKDIALTTGGAAMQGAQLGAQYGGAWGAAAGAVIGGGATLVKNIQSKKTEGYQLATDKSWNNFADDMSRQVRPGQEFVGVQASHGFKSSKDMYVEAENNEAVLDKNLKLKSIIKGRTHEEGGEKIKLKAGESVVPVQDDLPSFLKTYQRHATGKDLKATKYIKNLVDSVPENEDYAAAGTKNQPYNRIVLKDNLQNQIPMGEDLQSTNALATPAPTFQQDSWKNYTRDEDPYEYRYNNDLGRVQARKIAEGQKGQPWTEITTGSMKTATMKNLFGDAFTDDLNLVYGIDHDQQTYKPNPNEGAEEFMGNIGSISANSLTENSTPTTPVTPSITQITDPITGQVVNVNPGYSVENDPILKSMAASQQGSQNPAAVPGQDALANYKLQDYKVQSNPLEYAKIASDIYSYSQPADKVTGRYVQSLDAKYTDMSAPQRQAILDAQAATLGSVRGSGLSAAQQTGIASMAQAGTQRALAELNAQNAGRFDNIQMANVAGKNQANALNTQTAMAVDQLQAENNAARRAFGREAMKGVAEKAQLGTQAKNAYIKNKNQEVMGLLQAQIVADPNKYITTNADGSFGVKKYDNSQYGSTPTYQAVEGEDGSLNWLLNGKLWGINRK
jgi:hypothetical protein